MQLDKDLQAKQEARDLAKQADLAQTELFFYSQKHLYCDLYSTNVHNVLFYFRFLL